MAYSTCGECVDDGLDEYRGLGLVPLIGAALASPEGQGVAKKVVGAVVGGVKKLFGGGGPEDKPSGWENDALSGRVPCPTGGKMMYDYLDPAKRIPGHTGWRKGDFYGVSADELEAALAQTPVGNPGDPMFTREALIGVIRATNPSVRRPANIRELANAAQYIAHGKGDCQIYDKESPVAEHIDAILSRYRVASATLPSPDVDLANAASSLPVAIPGGAQIADVVQRNPVAAVGVIAALAFGASMLFRR